MMKYTPGPWKLSLKKSEYTFGEEQAKVLMLHGLPTKFNALSVGANDGRGAQMAIIPLDESSKSNGYLIAAAPEMYEALEWLLNLRSGRAKGGDDFAASAQWDDAWESAISAITKAEGRVHNES